MKPGLTKYNAEDKIILSGSITGMAQFRAFWSAQEFSTSVLESKALAPIELNYTGSGSVDFQLAISPNQLIPGLPYKFFLSAYYTAYGEEGVPAYAKTSITVIMNMPPNNGLFNVDPKNGLALNTSFFLVASAWSDEDLPLYYTFSTYLFDPKAQTIIKASDTSPNTRTVLGQGLRSQNFQVTCVATVADSFGYSKRVSSNVIVNPLLTLSQASNAMDTVLTSAFATKNPTAISNVVSALTANLNTVDCRGFPDNGGCAAVNRNPCTTTYRTCGECFEGFVGMSGHSNIACRRPSELLKTGEVCDSQVCLSGPCIGGYCTEAQKNLHF